MKREMKHKIWYKGDKIIRTPTSVTKNINQIKYSPLKAALNQFMNGHNCISQKRRNE